jgi:hypothetical protein
MLPDLEIRQPKCEIMNMFRNLFGHAKCLTRFWKLTTSMN